MKRALRFGFAATCALAAFASAPRAARAQEFSYLPPGDLTAGSGTGREDDTVYAPGMRYPVEETPSFLNSQVWGNGGGSGPGGGQCDAVNFSYPWRDNYCESRSWDMPLCPSGTGHQGQDIRGATCDKDVHWVVASAAGTVTNVGSYSVYVTAPDGTRYDYLHMGSVQVGVGDDVARGERIGRVSNEFGGTPTTVHLHFNLRQNVASVGNVYVPPYMSLVRSYEALIGPAPTAGEGTLDAASCEALSGWVVSADAPELTLEARLFFDGDAEGGQTVGHPVLADQPRDELCETDAGCAHGFSTGLPLSLLDGTEHTVHAYADDGAGASLVPLDGSPSAFTCTFELPAGGRRAIADQDVKTAWRFSSFWDEVGVSDGVLTTLDEIEALDAAPRLVASASDPNTMWLVDRGVRRPIPDALVARAWDFHPTGTEVLADDALAALPEGKPVRSRPVVLRAADGGLWLVDDVDPTSVGGGAGGSSAAGGDDGNGATPGDDGCSCAQVGTPRGASAPGWAGLGLLAGLWLLRGARRRP